MSETRSAMCGQRGDVGPSSGVAVLRLIGAPSGDLAVFVDVDSQEDGRSPAVLLAADMPMKSCPEPLVDWHCCVGRSRGVLRPVGVRFF